MSDEEFRVWMFENRSLMEIFWPKREEVPGDWRKLRNEIHNLFCRGSQMKKVELPEVCSTRVK